MKCILGIIIMTWSIFSSADDYPQVQVGEEEGFVDLTFKISKDNEGREFLVKGMLNGSRVGFALELLPDWSPQNVEELEDAFYWGGAYFKSIGKDTKEFIRALAKLYGASIAEFEVPDQVYAQVVGLACNPGQVKDTPCKTKFFFNPEGDEEIYSEVFVNIDTQSKTLEFNEKGTEYRAPLLRSLVQ